MLVIDIVKDATAAAGLSAVLVQGEGGDTAEDKARGIALHLVKLEPAE